MRATVVLLAALLLSGGCAPRTAAPEAPAPAPAGSPVRRALSVVASFYPLYEFARRIGGGEVEVRNLTPAGAEPHGYEPTPKDVAALMGARLLVYNGAGFEPWIEKLLPGLPATVERVNATAGLPLAKTGHEGVEKEGLDPHVWLDPLLARQQVDNIVAGFVKIDAERKALYAANAAGLTSELEALHRKYADTLRSCRRKTFITAHAAFGYLASRYGLKMVAISGVFPETEPSPARMKAIVKEARAHEARVIYFETLVSPKVAQAIAREVGARTKVLNPVEGLTPEEQGRGATYFSVMDENLRSLAAGLDCR
ncbi:MAG: metal ABC transporter solute-binding protein, Zn/Mn family [Armatimonadota bacterium]